MKRRRGESGAVAVEAALVTGLLVLIVIGAFEYGMAFRSWFGLVASSREGARVGASVGPVTDADCRIVEAAAAALSSTSDNEVVRVRVFQYDPVNGTETGSFNSYRPVDPDTPDDAILRCVNWWQEFYTWDETTRENTGEDRDWLGVEVEYLHSWITGLLWWDGQVQWSNQAIMRVEPVNYG
jgi:Flp pilus assembly pilin Flp